ncbi:DUF1835 domain-containing protein [Heyndrickxia sp. NPDC080065]|uniref:DUF1835 domain-containing protein n=1 Tax=Heyndrickxia sp. NPDC080065 TaxID=3390568 RepID=UPI003CFCA0E6
MKSRAKYPFVYFFMEPNIIFVYKIESDYYLNLETVSHRGEWKTFELGDGEDFDSFNHKESKALEGRGYLISQKDNIKMLNIINQQIQRHRQQTNQEDVSPVHIVSSEHAAGCLRVALERPKQVIGFPGFFSIGPLWMLESQEGQAFRNDWLKDHINFEMDDYVYENNFANTLLEIEDIIEKAPIHIWYGNNPDEQTGLRFILRLLKNKRNDIFLFNSSELFQSFTKPDDEEQNILHTAGLHPQQIRKIYDRFKTKPLTEKERVQYQNEWEILTQSKEILRLYKKNEIIHVPENYYDSLILDILKNLHEKQDEKDFILTGRLIGTLIQLDKSLDHSYMEYRIRELVYSGVLEMKGVPKSMRHYRVKLKM